MVAWSKPASSAAVSGYNIYVNGVKTGTVGKISWPSGLTNQQLFYDITGLNPGTQYSITVRAYDSAGNESADSNAVVQGTTATPVVVDVSASPYNAGSALSTTAIQAAIDACPSGGKVLFPAGKTFTSGSLYLKGDCTYQIDGTLVGSTSAADYSKGNNRFPNYGTAYPTNYTSLINTCRTTSMTCNVANIRLTGSGTIKGSSSLASAEGGGDNRGDLVSLTGVNGLYVAGLTLNQSSEHMFFVARSSNITLARVNVQSAGISNADGIDLVTSYADQLPVNGAGVGVLPTNAWIFGSIFNNGDDCINLNSGSGLPGVTAATPLNGLHIFNNYTEAGHGGVVYGSFTAAGLKNAWVTENTFEGTNIGFRFKTGSGHGGPNATLGTGDVGFIAVDNQIKGVGVGVEIVNNYPSTGVTPAKTTDIFRNITITNLNGTAKTVTDITNGANITITGTVNGTALNISR